LKKKRERLIERARLAKEFGRSVHQHFEQIDQIDTEIEKVHDQIHENQEKAAEPLVDLTL
jgi:hypothetical protein